MDGDSVRVVDKVSVMFNVTVKEGEVVSVVFIVSVR